MPRKNDSWGIEVGANAIKAMRLVRKGTRIELAEYDVLPFKQILTTPDLNVEEAIQVNLDTFLSKHDVAKSTVTVSVPGHAAFARFAKLPPVDPKKIPDIVRFEAVQQIPFPIEQVEWDYQVFQQEGLPDVEVGIFAITKERVMQFLNNYRRVDMRVDGITLSPLAVYNAFAYEQAQDTEHEGTIYLDIGTTCTDVIISEPEGLWMRTLPIGGNNFTEALVRSFKLSFPKAERLKREAGSSKYARQIFQAMRPVFAELVQELQRSLGYYQSLHRESRLSRLVGVGSTFRLPGLQKFLKQQLQMEVIRPQAFERIEIEGRRETEFADHTLNMATAYGLALQGLGQERISANLLPKQIQVRRMWKAKEPWIAGAAACIVAGAGIAAGSLIAARSAYQGGVEQYGQKTQGIYQTARSFAQDYQDQTGHMEPAKHIEVRRGMLDYRQLWPDLIEDVTEVVMSTNPQSPLASTSYETYEEAMRVPRDQRTRLYIESVQARYIPTPGEKAATAGQSTGENESTQRQEPTESTNKYSREYSDGQKLNADDFWGKMPASMDMEEYQKSLQKRREKGWRPPRIEFTVVGVSSFADASSLIQQHVIRWLETHTERKGRPYRIVVDPKSAIASLEAHHCG